MRYFPCPFPGCSKRFSTESKMRHHLRAHDKPFVCPRPECQRRFGYKCDLQRHIEKQVCQQRSQRRAYSRDDARAPARAAGGDSAYAVPQPVDRADAWRHAHSRDEPPRAQVRPSPTGGDHAYAPPQPTNRNDAPPAVVAKLPQGLAGARGQ